MGKRSKRPRSSDSSNSSESDSENEGLKRRLGKLEKMMRRMVKNKDGDSGDEKENQLPRSKDSIIGPGRSIPRLSTMDRESIDGNIDENESMTILSQDSQEEGPADPLSLEEVDVPPLDTEILQILGEDKTVKSDVGDIIHRDIAVRWNSILKEGIDEPIRVSLMKKYPPIKNCSAVGAPKLNKEVRAALTDSAKNRDDRLMKAQEQLGASLSAIGRALTILVGDQALVGMDKFGLIELLSDAGRLLADVHHLNSETRRGLAMVKLSKDLKDTFTEAGLDGWLFGDNLNERVKMAKAIEKSGKEIRESAQKHERGQKKSTSENLRRPLRYSARNNRLSGQKFNQNQYGRNQHYQQGYRQEKRGERRIEKRQGRQFIKK